ncbi:hypothetical protein [Spirosoma telluris]
MQRKYNTIDTRFISILNTVPVIIKPNTVPNLNGCGVAKGFPIAES